MEDGVQDSSKPHGHVTDATALELVTYIADLVRKALSVNSTVDVAQEQPDTSHRDAAHAA